MTNDWDEDAYPYNADAQPGDVDYRPGPDWPPSLDEIAWRKGTTWEQIEHDLRRVAHEEDRP